MILGAILLFCIYICLLVGNNIGVVMATILAFYGLYRLWILLEKKWTRYRALENAMARIYSIKYMYSEEQKKSYVRLAKNEFTCAIQNGYKPEKDDRWPLVKQYMDEIEGDDEKC